MPAGATKWLGMAWPLLVMIGVVSTRQLPDAEYPLRLTTRWPLYSATVISEILVPSANCSWNFGSCKATVPADVKRPISTR